MGRLVRILSIAQHLVENHRKSLLIIAGILLLICPRLWHMIGPIDDPHAWRQCDTANYALAFHKNGINLLYPSVCWMGDHKTVILEFPFPEMLMALAYNLFGYHLFLARVITLLFFSGSAVYFYLLVNNLFGRRMALISAAVYMVLPLSLFYSRAVHIDFFAVFFAHAMVYHFLRWTEQSSMWHAITGMLAGCLAFLIKVPYAFYLVLPLLTTMAVRRDLKTIPKLLLWMLFPVITFSLWHMHVTSVNKAAPDWYFIPGYFKFVDMGNWYYGPLEMRWDINVWKIFIGRFIYDIATVTGTFLFFIGVLSSFVTFKSYRRDAVFFLWAWSVGLICYLLIFLNLNRHDYYQIPFLPAVSLFIAIAIESAYRLFQRLLGKFSYLTAVCIYSALCANCILYAQSHYFRLDTITIEAGRIIDDALPANVTIIAASDMPTGCRDPSVAIIAASDMPTGCRDPRLLYHAKRNGWSIYKKHLTQEMINSLKNCGARYLVTVMPINTDTHDLYGYRFEAYPLTVQPWAVFIANLQDIGKPANLNPATTKKQEF